MATCAIDGCERLANARGWCKSHYMRWFKHGDVRAEVPLGVSRFDVAQVLGRVYGSWTVLSPGQPQHGSRNFVANCVCMCGAVGAIAVTHLERGKTSSCKSCSKASDTNQYPFKSWYLNKVKAGAFSRGLAYEVDADYLYAVLQAQGGVCARTGVPLTFGRTSRQRYDQNASLDRIDSRVGYVEGNVQWVTWAYNDLKQDRTEQEMFEMAQRIVNHGRV